MAAGKFIELQSNLGRKKLHRANQDSNFLEGSFSNRDNLRVPIQFRRESQPSVLREGFSSRTDQSIFTLIATVSWDQSNETSWVDISIDINKPLPAPVSHRSDSSSEANSSCCHRSDAWSYLE